MENNIFHHGGNIYTHAKKLNLSPSEIIDSSASLVPFATPKYLTRELTNEIKTEGFRYYPERNLESLKQTLGQFHNIDPKNILPGNGASELITWLGFEASKIGESCIPTPGFVDYERALKCWNADYKFMNLPKEWGSNFPQLFPLNKIGDVIWITNPHNPTGQLWSKKSLKEILEKYKLVICDEAFLSITPSGEKESLIPLTKKYDNLFVLRSLTKIFSIAGLRLGYVIGPSKVLREWSQKRDPWPVNSFAIKAGIKLLEDHYRYEKWTKKIHLWIKSEKAFIFKELSKIKNLKVHHSSTNYFLIESKKSLITKIKYLEKKGILIRDCSSFRSLDNTWARISLQTHKNNKRLIHEIKSSFNEII